MLRPSRPVLAAATVAALTAGLVGSVPTGADAADRLTQGKPTAIGRGGAVSTVDAGGHPGRAARAAPRRQRRRRGRRGGRSPGRDRAVLRRHRWRRLLRLLRRREEEGLHPRRSRDGAAGDDGHVVPGERRADRLQRGRHERAVGGRSRHAGHLGPGAEPLGHPVPRRRAQARLRASPGTASSSTTSFRGRSSTTRRGSATSRRPAGCSSRAARLRPSARSSATATSRGRTTSSAPRASAGSTAALSATASSRRSGSRQSPPRPPATSVRA